VLRVYLFCWWYADCRWRVSDDMWHPDRIASPPTRREKIDVVRTTPCWTRSLRAVRAWLAPAHWLARCWAAFSAMPPPPELMALIEVIEAMIASQRINLYLRI
jgi:hypothetical protein